MFAPLAEQMDIIRSGAEDVLPEEDLARKIERSIKTNKPLRIKFGCDPSRPDLHIGHAVVLHKMRQFQELGHTAVLIIGDFTAMIGDPSGRSKTRPALTLEETRLNGKSYVEQATLVLRAEGLEVLYNNDWLGKLSFHDVITLSSSITVAQMLERDDFTKRYKSNTPISLHEFLYPLAQGYDSVAMKSDVELGGTDQKFNLLIGRELQKSYGMEGQCIITMPILEGTDGVEKMSKSYNNYIGLTDSPREMFGRGMSVPDTLIARYFRYGACAKEQDIQTMQQGLNDGSLHPRTAKVTMAKAIVELYHGTDAAEAAFAEFERMFVKKDTPDDVELWEYNGDSTVSIADILVESGLLPTKGEARRMIEQGGVSIDGEKVIDRLASIDISQERLFKVGKRKFLRIKQA